MTESPKAVCSRIMYNASQKTWANRQGRIGEVLTGFDHFSGLRYSLLGWSRPIAFSSGTDGVGTKIELAERLSTLTGDFSYHKGIAMDLFAMICDDAAMRCGEPIHVVNAIACNKLNPTLIENLGEGIVDAALCARVAVTNGEVEELGNRVSGYGPFNYNWNGFVLWMQDPLRLIDGRNVHEGDSIVSIAEPGFRSNGLTDFRNIVQEAHGDNWHEKEFDGCSIAEVALQPSTIYCAAIIDMVGSFYQNPSANVKAFIHITGGGIPEKLGRALLPSGKGAILFDLFPPSRLMHYCQSIGKISDEMAYCIWNMGNGGLIVTDDPEKVIGITKKHSLEAKIAGEIVVNPGICIKNKGAYANRQREIVFNHTPI